MRKNLSEQWKRETKRLHKNLFRGRQAQKIIDKKPRIWMKRQIKINHFDKVKGRQKSAFGNFLSLPFFALDLCYIFSFF